MGWCYKWTASGLSFSYYGLTSGYSSSIYSYSWALGGGGGGAPPALRSYNSGSNTERWYWERADVLRNNASNIVQNLQQ